MAHNSQELGAAGAPIAAKTEQLRERWVSDELIDAGRARAASIGWPDAYAYTKALGEQALTEMKGNVPVSIVRPSIIESALAEPFPGWIRGFRMAEPVILSYARGLLKEFPGVPEGTVDVIPVDLVVAAIIAVAAIGPQHAPPIRVPWRGQPLRYQLWSKIAHGRRATCTARGPTDRRGRVEFPARGRVQKQLRRGKPVAEPGSERAARTARKAGWGRQGRTRERHRRASVVQLYGLYTECEAITRSTITDVGRSAPADQGECNSTGARSTGSTLTTSLPSMSSHRGRRSRQARTQRSSRPPERSVMSPPARANSISRHH